MSKKNRERRSGEGGVESADHVGGGVQWLPVVLAVGALGLGFLAWTDVRRVKDDTTRRLVDLDARLLQIQKDVANAAKPRPPQQQGPDPDKVHTVKTDNAPTKGNPTAPIVIAEFSDYQ